MKQFIAFVRKEFFHILHDRRMILILLGIPIMQVILFGFATTIEVENVCVTVLDPSNGVVTRQIIDCVDAGEYFAVIRSLYSPEGADHFFRRNDTDMAIVFSGHFLDYLYIGEAEVQIISDTTDPNIAAMQVRYAADIILVTGQKMFPPGVHTSTIVPQAKLLCNPQIGSVHNFVPDVVRLILMTVYVVMTSISVVYGKETGTMEVLLVSPVKPLFIILAKAISYFALSLANLITILLLSVYVLHVSVAGNLFWLVTVSLLFIFVSLALELLVSTVTYTWMAAMLVSGLVLMIPIMLLSGVIFPVENMPVILQSISAVIPAHWYIQAARKLMTEGVDISLVLTEIGILAVMAVLLITASFKKFKNRLE